MAKKKKKSNTLIIGSIILLVSVLFYFGVLNDVLSDRDTKVTTLWIPTPDAVKDVNTQWKGYDTLLTSSWYGSITVKKRTNVGGSIRSTHFFGGLSEGSLFLSNDYSINENLVLTSSMVAQQDDSSTYSRNYNYVKVSFNDSGFLDVDYELSESSTDGYPISRIIAEVNGVEVLNDASLDSGSVISSKRIQIVEGDELELVLDQSLFRIERGNSASGKATLSFTVQEKPKGTTSGSGTTGGAITSPNITGEPTSYFYLIIIGLIVFVFVVLIVRGLISRRRR